MSSKLLGMAPSPVSGPLMSVVLVARLGYRIGIFEAEQELSSA